MTGSPTPNSPTDAWAQCRLVTPQNLKVPRYFGRFRDAVMRQITSFKWIPKPNANDVVFESMQPAIRYALDDCVELPEQVILNREVDMTPEQKKAYKEMMTTLSFEASQGTITAANEAIKVNKLLQIACGVAYGVDNSLVILPNGPRIDAVKEVIEESEGKVIVFVPLTGALTHVAVEISKMFGKQTQMVEAVLEGRPPLAEEVAIVNGATSKTERDTIFADFQNKHILVSSLRTPRP